MLLDQFASHLSIPFYLNAFDGKLGAGLASLPEGQGLQDGPALLDIHQLHCNFSRLMAGPAAAA